MTHDDEKRLGTWLIRDEAAREYVVEAARAVESLVISTYGPTGGTTLVETVDPKDMPETVITGDAGYLLEAIERGGGFSHPVAALLVDGLDSVRRSLHDGTTAAALLTARLLGSGAELAADGLHPGTIAVGYAMAANRAGSVLDDLSRPVKATDRELLWQVAATTMTADHLDRRRQYADAVSAAVSSLAYESDDDWFDTDDITVRTDVDTGCALLRGHVVRRRPGAHETSERSRLSFDWSPAVEGVLTDARVAVLERGIDVEKSATDFGREGESGVTLNSAESVMAYAESRNAAVESVTSGVADLGADVLVVRTELDDEVKSAFESHGVAVIDRAQYPKSDIHRVARATGASVVGHVSDLDGSKLGWAGRVSERRVGDEKWAHFNECDGPVFTLLVGAPIEKGRTTHERLVADAVETTAIAAMDGQVLPGAGAASLAVARDLREFARGVKGTEQLAVEAFADACESLTMTLARNAGYDPLDARATLRNAHAGADERPAPVGLDVATGEAADAWEMGVVEPRRVFSQAVDAAVATVDQLATVDAVVSPGVEPGPFTPQTEHD